MSNSKKGKLILFRILLIISIEIFCGLSVFGANNPNLDERNSGYYPIDVTEYPELEPIYVEAPESNPILSFEEKKKLFEKIEAGYVETSTNTIYVSCREHNVGGHRVFLTHVLLKDPGSQLKVGISNDTFGGEREKTSNFAKRTGAVVAINGSYFYYSTGQPIDVCAPVVINDGKVLRNGNANGSEICIRFDGSFFSPHPMVGFSTETLLSMGVVANLGTADPLLISDGMPMSFPNGGVNDNVYPRSAVGVVWPGEYYLITAGEDGSYSGGLSYKQMQCIFYHLGCTYARSLDGGGSATLVVDGKLKNVPAEGTERAVVDFLAFYASDYTPDFSEIGTNEQEETDSIENRISIMAGNQLKKN